jgi:hypothetical protein
MYRFRVPEIFLGCFLTVAVFATGMLFEGPKQAPGPAQSISQQEAASEGHKAQNPDAELTGSTWLTKDAAGFFAFSLVLVGLGQALLFFVQLRYMRNGMDDATIAANAAKESADTAKVQAEVARDTLRTMQETAKQQLRAYIAVRDVRIYYADGEWQPNIQVTYRNYGQTPAHAVGNRINYFFQIAGPATFNATSENDPHLMYLAPSQEKTTTVLIPQVHWNLFKDAVAKKGIAFFIFGEIHYIDVFGEARWTKYRLQLDPDDDGIKEDGFTFCAGGNEAN